MSLFRTEALRVYMGESCLAVVRTVGRWRPHVIDAAELTVESGDSSAMAAAVADWATAQVLPAGTALHVVVAPARVPVLTLPWSEDLARPAFREALARGLLEKQLQQSPVGYHLMLGPLRYGQPQLAAFMAEGLLQDWQAAASRAGLRLASVTPLLAAVWNRLARARSRGEGRLVVVAEERVLTASHDGNHLQRMVLRPLDEAQFRSSWQWPDAVTVQALVPSEWQSRLPAHVRRLRQQSLGQGAALSHTCALALWGGD